MCIRPCRSHVQLLHDDRRCTSDYESNQHQLNYLELPTTPGFSTPSDTHKTNPNTQHLPQSYLDLNAALSILYTQRASPDPRDRGSLPAARGMWKTRLGGEDSAEVTLGCIPMSCMYIPIYIHTYRLAYTHTSMQACLQACTDVRMYACMHIWMHVYVYTCVYDTHTYVELFMPTYR